MNVGILLGFVKGRKEEGRKEKRKRKVEEGIFFFLIPFLIPLLSLPPLLLLLFLLFPPRYISNLLFSGLPNDLAWRVMVGMGAIPGLVLFVCIAMLPESPRWLFMHGFKGKYIDYVKKNNILDFLTPSLLGSKTNRTNKTKQNRRSQPSLKKSKIF